MKLLNGRQLLPTQSKDRSLTWLTLAVPLLFACGQNANVPANPDPYAGGVTYPWAYTAPAAQVAAQSLTAEVNSLSFEKILSAKNGWGPIERDRSNGEQKAGDGKALTLNGKTYLHGFGVHAGSELRFSLKGVGGATCKRFLSDIGVDDEVGSKGSVVFQVYLDGAKAYDSDTMTGSSATKKINLDISGKQELRLVVTDAGNGISYDHADWGSPQVDCRAVPLKFARTTLSSSDYHSLALRPDGTVAAWGFNNIGQTDVPANLGTVTSVAAGGSHSLALKSDGTVAAWGSNSSGQTDVPANLSGVLAVAAGGSHSLAIKADGTVVAWGDNLYRQIFVPASLGSVVAIAAGNFYSLALRSDGTVVAWGDSSDNQTNVPANLSGVVAISAVYDHSLALKSDGTVVAWGYNAYGQTDVPANLSGVVAVAAGGTHSLALKSDGTVVAWGYNASGQTNVPANLRGVVAISAGSTHSLALKSDGTVVAWGDNGFGQTNVPPGRFLAP